MLRQVIAVALIAASLATNAAGWADPEPLQGSPGTEPRSTTEAVEEATDPIPTGPVLTFEPGYKFPHGQSRYIAQLLFEPVIPYAGFFVPGFDVPDFRSVARLEVSGLSLQQSTPSGTTTASGLSDLDLADGVVHAFGALEVAAGFGAVFPLATDPALGQGKVQLGPAVVLAVLKIPWLQLAGVAQVLWSVAGDAQRASLAYATIAPAIALLLPENCSLFTDAQMSFAWEGGGTTVPVNLGFAHGFSEHFVGQLAGEYVVSGAGQGGIEGLVGLNFLP